MAANDFSPIYIGDTGAAFSQTFLKDDGSAQSLTGATITMKMLDKVSGISKNATGTWTIDNAANGLAHYTYSSADVSTTGDWTLYITITIGGSPVHASESVLEIRYAP